MNTSTPRIFNFSSGPAVLALPVLEEAQRDLVALPGVGMSVIEISHRSPTFIDILDDAIAGVRELTGIGSDYKILMLQGGASLQFSMVPMNLLTPGLTADYIDTGSWAKKAIKEARRVGEVKIVASTREEGYSRIPSTTELELTEGSAYTHITSNNTIEGTQWSVLPEVGDSPLVVDASSDILSRPIDFTRFGLAYAGAQKNLGPSGVTLVIVREDLLERSVDTLPSMLDYRTHVRENSLYNTPNTFGVYVLGLTVKWLRSLGGLAAIDEVNRRKAGALYAQIDRSGFYRGTVDAGSRSLMNVTFCIADEKLEQTFVSEAAEAGMDGLKGHRSVGGLRAGLYNAFPEEGVEALVQFMREFERRNG
jgi:phosphoserine aminotransferase